MKQEDSLLHDQAFLVWFAAVSIQQNSILSMTELGTSEQRRSAMTSASRSKGINNDVYDTLLRSVVLPNTLVKIGYSATYLRLITGERARQANSHDSIEWLGEIAQSNINAYYEKLETNSNIMLDALKTVTHPR